MTEQTVQTMPLQQALHTLTQEGLFHIRFEEVSEDRNSVEHTVAVYALPMPRINTGSLVYVGKFRHAGDLVDLDAIHDILQNAEKHKT